MEISLDINPVTCICCGHCVQVCPSAIFVQPAPKAKVSMEHIQACIRCGHCVAVCPTEAVIHGEFPAEKVHRIERRLLPSPEQVMLLINSRRSNRALSTKPVPIALLDQILEAAHRAPTASNLQKVEFTLVTDPKQLHAISSFTIDTFDSLARMLDKPIIRLLVKQFMPQVRKYLPVFRRMKREFGQGKDRILRGATAVIFIHVPPKSTQYGVEDCNLAYQNGSLMAESLGVSQFYTGFVMRAIKMDKKKRLAGQLGIEGNICAGMALGMPEFHYPNYIDREPIRVKRW